MQLNVLILVHAALSGWWVQASRIELSSGFLYVQCKRSAQCLLCHRFQGGCVLSVDTVKTIAECGKCSVSFATSANAFDVLPLLYGNQNTRSTCRL